MLAKMTAPDLPQDCSEAEQLIERHKEYKSEIEARRPKFDGYIHKGKGFIREEHYLTPEIEDKVRVLEQRMDLLDTIWNKRKIIYDQNLDVQLFYREVNILENWLKIREKTLKDSKYGKYAIECLL